MPPKKEGVSDTDQTHTRNTNKIRVWAWTLFNYDQSDIDKIIKYFKNKKDRYIFGEEICPETHKPHLQGAFKFINGRTFEQIKLIVRNDIHLTIGKKVWQANCNYCSKDGRTFTNEPKFMKREERILEEEYENVKWNIWQQLVIEILEKPPDKRTVNWFWETTGNKGKSFLAKYVYCKYGAIIADGKKDNIFNQIKGWIDTHRRDQDPHVIMVDIPRYNGEILNYGCLEQIKNGLIYSGKYEGGTCVFRAPHIIIFSNQEPRYEMLSEDRWRVINIDQYENQY